MTDLLISWIHALFRWILINLYLDWDCWSSLPLLCSLSTRGRWPLPHNTIINNNDHNNNFQDLSTGRCPNKESTNDQWIQWMWTEWWHWVTLDVKYTRWSNWTDLAILLSTRNSPRWCSGQTRDCGFNPIRGMEFHPQGFNPWPPVYQTSI